MRTDMERGKILIVDDSEMNRAILTDILQDEYDICRITYVKCPLSMCRTSVMRQQCPS